MWGGKASEISHLPSGLTPSAGTQRILHHLSWSLSQIHSVAKGNWGRLHSSVKKKRLKRAGKHCVNKWGLSEVEFSIEGTEWLDILQEITEDHQAQRVISEASSFTKRKHTHTHTHTPHLFPLNTCLRISCMHAMCFDPSFPFLPYLFFLPNIMSFFIYIHGVHFMQPRCSQV